jgi:hypothetical protein
MHGDGVDEAARDVEQDLIGRGCGEPVLVGPQDTPEPAEAPAKLAARIVGDLPQEVTEPGPHDRLRRERKKTKQSSYLA